MGERKFLESSVNLRKIHAIAPYFGTMEYGILVLQDLQQLL